MRLRVMIWDDLREQDTLPTSYNNSIYHDKFYELSEDKYYDPFQKIRDVKIFKIKFISADVLNSLPIMAKNYLEGLGLTSKGELLSYNIYFSDYKKGRFFTVNGYTGSAENSVFSIEFSTFVDPYLNVRIFLHDELDHYNDYTLVAVNQPGKRIDSINLNHIMIPLNVLIEDGKDGDVHPGAQRANLPDSRLGRASRLEDRPTVEVMETQDSVVVEKRFMYELPQSVGQNPHTRMEFDLILMKNYFGDLKLTSGGHILSYFVREHVYVPHLGKCTILDAVIFKAKMEVVFTVYMPENNSIGSVILFSELDHKDGKLITRGHSDQLIDFIDLGQFITAVSRYGNNISVHPVGLRLAIRDGQDLDIHPAEKTPVSSGSGSGSENSGSSLPPVLLEENNPLRDSRSYFSYLSGKREVLLDINGMIFYLTDLGLASSGALLAWKYRYELVNGTKKVYSVYGVRMGTIDPILTVSISPEFSIIKVTVTLTGVLDHYENGALVAMGHDGRQISSLDLGQFIHLNGRTLDLRLVILDDQSEHDVLPQRPEQQRQSDAPALDDRLVEHVIDVNETGGTNKAAQAFSLPDQSLDKSSVITFDDSFTHEAIEKGLASLGLTSGRRAISYQVGSDDLDSDGDKESYILASVGDDDIFRIIIPDKVTDDLIVEMFGDLDHLSSVDDTLYSTTYKNGVAGVDIGQYLNASVISGQSVVSKRSVPLFLRFEDGSDEDVPLMSMIDV